MKMIGDVSETLSLRPWKADPQKALINIRSKFEPVLKQLHPNHFLWIDYHLVCANTYGTLKKFHNAAKHMEELCAVAKTLFPPNFGEISQYFHLLGAFHEHAGSLGLAPPEESFQQALIAYDEAHKIASISYGPSSSWTLMLALAKANLGKLAAYAPSQI